MKAEAKMKGINILSMRQKLKSYSTSRLIGHSLFTRRIPVNGNHFLTSTSFGNAPCLIRKVLTWPQNS